MTHRAESIIDAVVTKVTGLATTAARVYRGRSYALDSTNLPCLLIYLGPDEPLSKLYQDKVDSLLTIYVESRVKSPTAQIDETLNTIREEVTIALQADYTQGLGYVIDTIEGDVDAPEIVATTDQPVGAMRMAWQFHYRRSRTNPGA